MTCPRCLSDDTYTCREGKENGQVVWTMYYCNACDFNWRDSEPETTINSERRPSVFRMDPTQIENFDVVIPPLKR
jgi:hypothetical protein